MSAAELLSHLVAPNVVVHVSDEDAGVVRLDLLYVSETHRGRGLAKETLSGIATWADETGTVIVLTATYGLGADILRLTTLYAAFEFIPVEVTAMTEVRMRRDPLAMVPALLLSMPPVPMKGPIRSPESDIA